MYLLVYNLELFGFLKLEIFFMEGVIVSWFDVFSRCPQDVHLFAESVVPSFLPPCNRMSCRALFRRWEVRFFTVVFSFVFDKYCSIMG
jgi:hypothetical protein